MKKHIYIATIGILVGVTPVFSQTTKYSGIWKLIERASITGPDYANGIPKFITIDQQGNFITINTITESQPQDQVIIEKLEINGKALQEITDSKRTKTVTISISPDEHFFIRKSSYSLPDTPAKMDYLRVDTFEMYASKDSMILLRNYQPFSNESADWLMRGSYVKISENELQLYKATGKGIFFENELSWKQLLQKARKQKKYLFVDCYATWCGPCKIMDKQVYPIDLVGNHVSPRFISLKLQMDTGKNDNSYTKSFYGLAKDFATKYRVQVLPTYLIFSANGELLHKGVGKLSVDKFIDFINNATDTAQQIFHRVNRWKKNQIESKELPQLARDLNMVNESSLANEVARSYMKNYLERLPEKEFLKDNNLVFINEFLKMLNSSDRIFQIALRDTSRSNDYSFNKELADYIVETVVRKEDISQDLARAIELNADPDWSKMENVISGKYSPEFAKKIIVDEQVYYYKNLKKNSSLYIKYLNQYINLIGLQNIRSWMFVNSAANDVFHFSNDMENLKKAMEWNKRSFQLVYEDTINRVKWTPLLITTRADLLYKMGFVKEAIELYNTVFDIFSGDLTFDPYHRFQMILEKMKRGESTW